MLPERASDIYLFIYRQSGDSHQRPSRGTAICKARIISDGKPQGGNGEEWQNAPPWVAAGKRAIQCAGSWI